MITTAPRPRRQLFGARWKLDDWRALYFLNLFRLATAACLTAVALWNGESIAFDIAAPVWFLTASVMLLICSTVYFLGIHFSRLSFTLQAGLQFAADIGLISLLAWASEGISAELSILYVIVVAAAGVVLSQRLGLFFAALGTLAGFLVHLLHTVGRGQSADPAAMAMFGAALFATAMIITLLAERVRRAQAENVEHQREIVELEEINALVVETMDIGVIVVDRDDAIQRLNTAGRTLLALPMLSLPARLSATHSELGEIHRDWRRGQAPSVNKINHNPPGTRITATLISFGEAKNLAAIFLSDEQARVEQALNQRLAALGRLAAAVAHEIRNPLTAINTGVELLADRPGLPSAESKALKLIRKNCRRIDRIVNSTLSTAGPEPGEIDEISLVPSVDEFIDEFVATQGIRRDQLSINRPCDAVVSFTPTHLHQVLDNICSNALMHHPQKADARIRFELRESDWLVDLDIVNNSPPINEEHLDKIFEPFFTTRSDVGGTGLGLYLSRQLCEINQAELQLIHPHPDGNCFRITFGKVRHAQRASG